MCNVSKKLSPSGENPSALMASMTASPIPASASTASNTVTVVVEDLVGGLSEVQQRGIGEKRELQKKVPYQNVTLAGTPLGQLLSASNSSLNMVGEAAASSNSQVFRAGGISQPQNSLAFQLEDKKAEESQSTNNAVKKVLHHEQQQQLQLLKKAALEAAACTKNSSNHSGQANSSASMASSTASLVLSGGCVINLMSASTENQVINVHHHHHHHFDNVSGKMTTLTTSSSELPGSNPVRKSQSSSRPPALLPLSSSSNDNDISSPQQQNISDLTVENIRNHQNQNFYVNLSNIARCLNMNKYLLEQCGFYYGAINWSQSTELLRKTSEGTFLVRDSSDSRFLYTLSVQRTPEDGPTSVRIHFAKGKFRLDADEKIEKLMPTFDSILDLVKHYCSLSQSERAKSHIWVDNVTGNLYSPICLRKPLKKEVSTLAHTARLAVNQSLKSQTLLPELNLPNRITNYLGEYPHEM
jgi:hypothetical protein